MRKALAFAYSIWDPTGNITALVESPVEIAEQPAAAARIMEAHGEVEQVGFVRFFSDAAHPQAELRMAGGEFCGNASMCTAALCRLQGKTAQETIDLRVSGALGPVQVTLHEEGDAAFRAGIRMPYPKEIRRDTFVFEELKGELQLVRMDGISHLIARGSSPLYGLKDDPVKAGRAIKAWCGLLGADGLGLMFLDASHYDDTFIMPPLVYVPGSGTLFYEHSCASGSAAAGAYLSAERGRPVRVLLHEPGGDLLVTADHGACSIHLHGHVRLLKRIGKDASLT